MGDSRHRSWRSTHHVVAVALIGGFRGHVSAVQPAKRFPGIQLSLAVDDRRRSGARHQRNAWPCCWCETEHVTTAQHDDRRVLDDTQVARPDGARGMTRCPPAGKNVAWPSARADRVER